MSDESFLYLVTRGHKSGEPRQIEIWYVELDGRFYVAAENRENAKWVKNLRTHAGVSFSVGSRVAKESDVQKTRAEARVVDDAAEAELATRVRHLMAAKYGWGDGLVVEIVPAVTD